MAKLKACTVSGCRQEVYSFGLCRKHAHRFKKHGDPLAGGTFNGEAWQWLLDHVEYVGEACLRWPFYRKENGYGRVTKPGGRKQLYAHREMCRLAHGEPPTSKHEVAHNCGMGHEGCVHPKHLRWDTVQGNADDRVVHGTENKGEKNGAAKLTVEQVREIRSQIGLRSNRLIAEEYGLCRQTISDIARRRRWGWLL